MSNKNDLRTQRNGTIINTTSKAQEKRLGNSLVYLHQQLSTKHGVQIIHESEWRLRDVVGKLRHNFPEVTFNYYFNTTSMRPDGGILSLVDKHNTSYPILITEVKNQGTNDLRESEGKSKQARGNAIERLGKNVIGFRASLLNESIFPFVCFGDGCDFAHDSSIVDRVVTIAMFGDINKTSLHNEGNSGQFNRGSFYFRVKLWTEEDMFPIMLDIADRSILYYFSKYGISLFK